MRARAYHLSTHSSAERERRRAEPEAAGSSPAGWSISDDGGQTTENGRIEALILCAPSSVAAIQERVMTDLKIYGEDDDRTVAQMWRWMGVGSVAGGGGCAGGHHGPVAPGGGGVAPA